LILIKNLGLASSIFSLINISSIFESFDAPTSPIISVSEPSAFFPSIKEYGEALGRTPKQLQSLPSSSSALALLEHVAAGGPSQRPSQHDINVLSDLFPSLRALSSAIRTEDGRKLLADYLRDSVGSAVIEFWEQEWI
jgi:hypothetical protein